MKHPSKEKGSDPRTTSEANRTKLRKIAQTVGASMNFLWSTFLQHPVSVSGVMIVLVGGIISIRGLSDVGTLPHGHVHVSKGILMGESNYLSEQGFSGNGASGSIGPSVVIEGHRYVGGVTFPGGHGGHSETIIFRISPSGRVLRGVVGFDLHSLDDYAVSVTIKNQYGVTLYSRTLGHQQLKASIHIPLRKTTELGFSVNYGNQPYHDDGKGAQIDFADLYVNP